MALIDELKVMLYDAQAELEQEEVRVIAHQDAADELNERIADLKRTIAALEPALTDEQPELFEAEQEAASEQLASDHALPPAADDVVAEEAPEPEFIELDEQTCEPVEEAPALNEAMQDEREEGYAPVTNPEADQVVSAMSWYSPKEIAERNKFDPFGLFKREKEDA